MNIPAMWVAQWRSREPLGPCLRGMLWAVEEEARHWALDVAAKLEMELVELRKDTSVSPMAILSKLRKCR